MPFLFSPFTFISTSIKRFPNSLLFLNTNTIKRPQPLVTISPGGLKGYYLLGIASFILDTYDVNFDEYIFSGASAGAWVSLFLTYKYDKRDLISKILKISSESPNYNIQTIGKKVKTFLLNNCSTDDFDFSRLHICVTEIKLGEKPIKIIYTNFASLEDAIDCCIASSYVPFISGKNAFKIYKNKNIIDGGFNENPYIDHDYHDNNTNNTFTNNVNRILHIHPLMWDKNGENNNNNNNMSRRKKLINQLTLFANLFFVNHFNLTKIYMDGYDSAVLNKEFLDSKFLIPNS
jgi:hypothetical protein